MQINVNDWASVIVEELSGYFNDFVDRVFLEDEVADILTTLIAEIEPENEK